MITIERDGSLSTEDDGVKKYLMRHSGKWRVISTVPRLLVLQKIEGEGKGSPRALLNGSVERPGWLIEIVNFITNARLSGDLVVVSNNVQRELIFEKGALRVAFSTSQADLLGEFILSKGLLPKEQLDRALKAQRSDKKLGQVLVEMGLLTGAEVHQILQRKTEQIFYDTIGVGEGVYHFITDFAALKLPASMYMDTQVLLMEGVKRIDDLEFYNQTIPRRAHRLAVAPGPLDGLTDAERGLLDSVDGRKTLADIDMQIHLGVDEMLAQTHRLVSKGMIEIFSAREMEEQALRSVVNSFNGALDTIVAACQGVLSVQELSRIGSEFISNGAHNNRTLRKLALAADGRLQMENVRAVFKEATERDRTKLIVMVLTQYVSYVLFNAIERLPAQAQEPLSTKVNEALSEIFASNL